MKTPARPLLSSLGAASRKSPRAVGYVSRQRTLVTRAQGASARYGTRAREWSIAALGIGVSRPAQRVVVNAEKSLQLIPVAERGTMRAGEAAWG